MSLLVCNYFLPFLSWFLLELKSKTAETYSINKKRVGLYNKTFYLYKFQSYIQGAEKNGPEWSQMVIHESHALVASCVKPISMKYLKDKCLEENYL